MSIELKDYRGRITPETDCVLEAKARATGRERQEIVREILHEWALREIHGASMLDKLLRAEGIEGIGDGTQGNARASRGSRRGPGQS